MRRENAGAASGAMRVAGIIPVAIYLCVYNTPKARAIFLKYPKVSRLAGLLQLEPTPMGTDCDFCQPQRAPVPLGTACHYLNNAHVATDRRVVGQAASLSAPERGTLTQRRSASVYLGALTTLPFFRLKNSLPTKTESFPRGADLQLILFIERRDGVSRVAQPSLTSHRKGLPDENRT